MLWLPTWFRQKDRTTGEQAKLTIIEKCHFQAGRIDPLSGKRIKQDYALTDEYVIYRIDHRILVYTWEKDLNLEERTYQNRYLRISPNLGRINALQPEELSWSETINRQIAHAIVQCLTGNSEQAISLLDECEERLKRLRAIETQLWYQFGGMLLGFICLSSLILFRVLSDDKLPRFNSWAMYSNWQIYLEVATCGALGGFLSVSLGIRKLRIDLDRNRKVSMIEGSTRIWIAIVASIFVYLCIKSGIIFGALSDTNSNFGIYALCVVAGFSETFVPNLMRQISSRESGDS